MKTGLLLLGLWLAVPAQGKLVYECKDGQRFLRIHQMDTGRLAGYLRWYSYDPKRSNPLLETVAFKCVADRGGERKYACTRGDYIAHAYARRGKATRVTLELAGDFGPFDSGYLHSYYCE